MAPVPPRCTAHNKAGGHCGQPAIRGGNVCRYHGGGAPQVKASAALRLAALIDPAIGVLAAAMKQRKDLRARLNAAQDVLDRNNLSGKQQIEVTTVLSAAETLRRRRAARLKASTEDETLS